MDAIVKVEGITKHYKEFTLDHVSFQVPRGMILGLIGENGAGKSTTISALLDLISLDRGSIEIFGQSHEKTAREAKARMGVIIDGLDPYLMYYPGDVEKIMSRMFPGRWDGQLFRNYMDRFKLPREKRIKDYSKGMRVKFNFAAALSHRPELMSDTIGENIRLGQPGDIGPSLAAAQLDREVAAMPLGEETPVGSQGVRLSGGQQARLALARTLYQSRPLVVLDDPFSAVDRQTEGKMLAALRQWGQGRVILLISHRLDRFPQLDQVVWLADGASDAGTHAELMERQPLYRQLFLQQQQGGDLDEA